jgi:hypothetical protein
MRTIRRRQRPSAQHSALAASRLPGAAQPLRVTVYKIILTPAAINSATTQGAPTFERQKLVLRRGDIGARHGTENRWDTRIHAAPDIVPAMSQDGRKLFVSYPVQNVPALSTFVSARTIGPQQSELELNALAFCKQIQCLS